MSVPQYALVAASGGPGGASAAMGFYLTGITGFSSTAGSNSATITSYKKYGENYASPAYKGLGDAFNRADSAGPAVIVFYVFAIIALLLHTVSTIMFACNLRSKTPAQPCPAQFTLAPYGITFASVGITCFLIAAAITWGVFGGLIDKYLSTFSSTGILSLYIVTYPGAGLAVTGLLYMVVAWACEMGSKLCCKDWKPPTPGVFNQQAPTTVIVTNGMHGGGGVVIQQGGFTSGGPMAVSIPAPAYAVGAPQMMAQPAPMDANQWKVQQNGKDTC